MRHYCITCKHLICIECIVDHSGHEFVRKEESSKSPLYSFAVCSPIILAFILKENADNIVNSLNNLSERTEILLSDTFKLTKDMKTKKIKDMKSIDETFDKLIRKIQVKKA